MVTPPALGLYVCLPKLLPIEDRRPNQSDSAFGTGLVVKEGNTTMTLSPLRLSRRSASEPTPNGSESLTPLYSTDTASMAHPVAKFGSLQRRHRRKRSLHHDSPPGHCRTGSAGSNLSWSQWLRRRQSEESALTACLSPPVEVRFESGGQEPTSVTTETVDDLFTDGLSGRPRLLSEERLLDHEQGHRQSLLLQILKHARRQWIGFYRQAVASWWGVPLLLAFLIMPVTLLLLPVLSVLYVGRSIVSDIVKPLPTGGPWATVVGFVRRRWFGFRAGTNRTQTVLVTGILLSQHQHYMRRRKRKAASANKDCVKQWPPKG